MLWRGARRGRMGGLGRPARRPPLGDTLGAWRELHAPRPRPTPPPPPPPPLGARPPPYPRLIPSFLESRLPGDLRRPSPGDPRPPARAAQQHTAEQPAFLGFSRNSFSFLLLFLRFGCSFGILFSSSLFFVHAFILSFLFLNFGQRVTLFAELLRERVAAAAAGARSLLQPPGRTMRAGLAGERSQPPGPLRRCGPPRDRGPGGEAGGLRRGAPSPAPGRRRAGSPAAGSINRKVLPFSPGRILLKAGLGGRHLPAIFFPLLLFASLPPPGLGGVGRAGVCVCVGWRE